MGAEWQRQGNGNGLERRGCDEEAEGVRAICLAKEGVGRGVGGMKGDVARRVGLLR